MEGKIESQVCLRAQEKNLTLDPNACCSPSLSFSFFFSAGLFLLLNYFRESNINLLYHPLSLQCFPTRAEQWPEPFPPLALSRAATVSRTSKKSKRRVAVTSDRGSMFSICANQRQPWLKPCG